MRENTEDLGMGVGGVFGQSSPWQVSLFEPMHGSAPDIAKKRIANPTATALAVGLRLE